MQIKINTNDPLSIYMQIVNQIKFAIARGILKPHDQLPSIQRLASDILINPNTIVRAYKELEYQNIIYTKRGEGSFVCEHQPDISYKEKSKYLDRFIDPLIIETRFLGLSQENLVEMIKQKFDPNAYEKNWKEDSL